jgi:SH3 domain protein
MRCRIIPSVLLLLTFCLPAVPAFADTRYVVDELIITMRLGKGTGYKILKSLKTGTAVEVLEDDDKSYLKVRTADGVEGYVLRQYISKKPPKTKQIEELEALNRSQQKQINSLETARNVLAEKLETIEEEYGGKFAGMSSRAAGLEQELEQAVSRERLLAERYTTLETQSKNVVAIAADRDDLQQRNIKLETEVMELRQKSEKLADTRMIKWFLAGGGVFLFGWIAGKISRKKRSRF